MKKRQKLAWLVLLSVGLVWTIHSVPKVQASDGAMSQMIWMPTSNWLGCEQESNAPECAKYGTPTGGVAQMTCCVPRSALGTSDMSACADGGIGRGRTELSVETVFEPILFEPTLFEPIPLAASCSSQCQALYLSCLDDCDTAPFPGCYNHCRFDVLYPCYKSCF